VNQGRIAGPRCASTKGSGILTRQGNRSLKKNPKKGRRIGRHPKTTRAPVSPRRVVVFKPSAVLKQRINGHSPGNS